MTRCSSRTRACARARLARALLGSALGLVLAAVPVSTSPDGPALDWQAALAKDGGNGGGGGGNGSGGGGGNGNGPGGERGERGSGKGERGGPDRGPGSRGHAYGHDKASGGRAGGYHDMNEFVDSVRSGKAFGHERRDARLDQAKERYGAALGKTNRDTSAGHGRSGTGEVGPVAHQLTKEEAKALMERGWKGPKAQSAGFRNHGERVSTMVELAKQLGYGARVGALQANFGTPYENGIAGLQAELEEARAAGNAAEVERLEGELAAAIDQAKPGKGPDDSWATADLDVNDDGMVDRQDLEALEESKASAGTDEQPPAS